MLAYSELRGALDFILKSGLVTKVYQDVIILENGGNRYPAYRVGDDYEYIGVDDTKLLFCYVRQIGNVEKIKTEFTSSAQKTFISKVGYRFVFLNDWEKRNFDSLYSKILQITNFKNIDFRKLITDRNQLLKDESKPKAFVFGGFSFYCGLDIDLTFRMLVDECETPVDCDNMPNPLTCGAPIIQRNLNETDPVWISERGNYYTKTEINDFFANINAVSAFVHNQNVAASTWNITHGLGFYPAGIIVKDSANGEWIPEVNYIDIDTVQLNFGNSAFTGKAYLS